MTDLELTRRQRQTMDALIGLGDGTVAQIGARLEDPPSYNTVRKILSILEELLEFASKESRSQIALEFSSLRELKHKIERLLDGQHAIWSLGRFVSVFQLSIAMAVSLFLSICIGLGGWSSAIATQNPESQQQFPTKPTPIGIAISALAQKPAWSHLPLDLERQVSQQILSGPEFNIQIRLTDDEKNPASGILCAIMENQTERINRQAFSKNSNLRIDALPLCIGVTNHLGECTFEKIRGRHPADSVNGIVQPLLVLLHPEYGLRVVPLKRSNRMQLIEREMEPGKILSGDILDLDGSPIDGVAIEIGLRQQLDEFGESRSLFGRSSILAPIAKTNERGAFAFEGLPPNHSVTLIPIRSGFEIASDTNPIATTDLATSVGHTEISMRLTQKPALRFKCVDSRGTSIPPDPSVGFPPGQALELDSDANYVTRAYEKASNGRYALRLNIPSPWMSVMAVRQLSSFEEPFSVSMVRGRMVRGRVIDAITSRPIAGVPVFGREQVPKATLDVLVNGANSYEVWRTESLTNERGEFELPITDSVWKIIVDGPIYGYDLNAPSETQPYEFVDVSASSESPQEISFRLTPTKKMQGVLLSGDGKPIPNAEVACSYLSTDLNETIALTNAMGEFEILPPPGKAKRFELLARMDGEQAFLTVPTDWAKTKSERFELRLKSAPDERVIEGRILVDGQGRAGVEVAITPGENMRLLMGGGIVSQRTGYVARATSGSDGTYRIVIPDSEHGRSSFYIIAPQEFATRNSIPSVGLDEKKNSGPNMEFITKPGKKAVRGKVLSLRGEPLEGATVYLRFENSFIQQVGVAKQESSAVKTNDKGEFEFKDLPNTTFQLQAQSPTKDDLWSLVVRKSCNAGDTDVILIMDKEFLESPEKIVPLARKNNH